MSKHLSIISNIILALQVLLLFCCFADLSELPIWIIALGKLHPLLLHLPISLIVINIPLYFITQGSNKPNSSSLIFQISLVYTALLTTITAFAGLLLASNGEYDEEILLLHKWLSVGLAIITHVQIYAFQRLRKNQKVLIGSYFITAVLMIMGSHHGGTLTHGEDFLDFKSEEKVLSQFSVIEDKTTVYEAAVSPIISAKCLSCHNDTKTKGGLNMNNFQLLQKGGKNGAIFTAGNPDASMMIERMLLDMDDKKHMPPRGKAQLTNEEIMLFTKWIASGASDKTNYHSLNETDSLKILADQVRDQSTNATVDQTYNFKSASTSTIQELNTPFRRILPLSASSPALSIKFFLKEKFTLSMLEECKSIKEQVVEINFSSMPVDDKVLPILTQFENLEKLNLNGTLVSGKNLGELVKLKNLKQLSLTGTAIDIKALNSLSKSSIKTIYVWNTKINEAELASLKKNIPAINWDLGYIPDKNEVLKLTPPKPLNTDQMIIGTNENIILKHPLPGVIIKYTTDGSNPDSIKGITYKDPVPSSQITRVIAIATRPGWISSDASDYTFFQKGFMVDSVRLINKPAEKYNKNAQTVLTDLKKGFPEILNLNWLGYKEQSFKTGFYFKDENIKSKIVLSAADNTGAYVFPPTKIIIWGGDNPKKLKMIGSIRPEMPIRYRSNGVIPYIVPIEKGKYKYIEIEATNIQSLPSWHGGKGEKGWVFVDEVFFY
jgi:uncharacterized membrane protein